jgi:hypothetical protein
MNELLTAIGMLAVILTAVAIMLRIVSVEDAGVFVGRAEAAVVLMILALCILKGLWIQVIAPWLSSALGFLIALMGWFVIGILGVIALLFVGRLALGRFGRYLPLLRNPLKGNRYDTHGSHEERD